jgi:hypothetical protein
MEKVMPKPGRSNDGPRFTVSPAAEGDNLWIYDDDFGYDASMLLTGDFSPEDKMKYAQAVCDVLNSAGTVKDIPTRDSGGTAE